MQLGEVLGKAFYWGKEICGFIAKWAVIIAGTLWELFSSLHIGDRLVNPLEKIGIKLTGRTIDKIICIILCAALILGLFAMCAPEKSGGGGSSLFEEDCWACGGSGNCGECGGDGRVVEWMGDQYIDVRCTSCSGGRCSWCNGSGHE